MTRTPEDSLEAIYEFEAQRYELVPLPPLWKDGGPIMAVSEKDARLLAFADLFQAARPPSSKLPFVPGTGLCDYWLEHYEDLGSAVGPERHAKDDSGATLAVYQAFSRAVLRWTPDGVTKA